MNEKNESRLTADTLELLKSANEKIRKHRETLLESAQQLIDDLKIVQALNLPDGDLVEYEKMIKQMEQLIKEVPETQRDIIVEEIIPDPPETTR